MYDEVTELQNNIKRWYNPELGKWLSEDPIGFEDGDTNIYRYVGNSAPNFHDAFSLCSIPGTRAWWEYRIRNSLGVILK